MSSKIIANLTLANALKPQLPLRKKPKKFNSKLRKSQLKHSWKLKRKARRAIDQRNRNISKINLSQLEKSKKKRMKSISQEENLTEKPKIDFKYF